MVDQFFSHWPRLRHLITHQVDGFTGYHEFPSLAEEYESRAQKYREALGIWFLVKISGFDPTPTSQDLLMLGCASGKNDLIIDCKQTLNSPYFVSFILLIYHLQRTLKEYTYLHILGHRHYIQLWQYIQIIRWPWRITQWCYKSMDHVLWISIWWKHHTY